jgi:DNA-binding transcriptional ArsR family regulator
MSIKDNIINRTAGVIRVLGHPVRIRILDLLDSNGELSVTEVYERIGISQPEASRHLTVMKNRSLLRCEKRQGHSFYRVSNDYPFVQEIILYLKHPEGKNKIGISSARPNSVKKEGRQSGVKIKGKGISRT